MQTRRRPLPQTQSQPSDSQESREPQTETSEDNPCSSSIASTSSHRVGRHKSLGIRTSKLIEKTRRKPRIVIPLGKTCPLEDLLGSTYATELGIVCRQFAPLAFKQWSKVPETDKDVVYKHLLDRLDIDLSLPHVKKVVNRALGVRFRNYKCRVHSYVKKHGGPLSEAAREKPFDNIEQFAWLEICDHFASPEFQMRSKINKRNRMHLTTNHCAGSRPFVRVRYNMRDPETGQEPDPIAFYRATHFRRNDDGSGSWVAPECEQNYNEMVRRRDRHPNHTPEQICSEVLGTRSGYIKGLGHGEVPSSSQLKQRSSPINRCISVDIEAANRRAEAAEWRAKELESVVAAQKRRIDETQEQVARLDATLKRVIALLP